MNADQKFIRAGMELALLRARMLGPSNRMQHQIDIRNEVSHITDFRRFKVTSTDCFTYAQIVIETNDCPPKTIVSKFVRWKELFESRIAVRYGKWLLGRKKKYAKEKINQPQSKKAAATLVKNANRLRPRLKY